ncbi:MAG: tRNA (adenosine(37)-N6)-dimethylallyltransferase MiaA [Bacteroidia bacterium]|jgi:tRNA dimethylallyltransferase
MQNGFNNSTTKKLICIVGPTASGKTSLAIKIASLLNTEIISADSRQVYKELSIGTAVPSQKELSEIKHHFIQHKSIFENYSVADFEKEAIQKIEDLFESHDYVVLVGGTGLYIKAIEEGFDDLPQANYQYRQELESLLSEKGIAYLQNLLMQKDIQAYSSIDIQNPRRLIRVLEILELSGEKLSASWQHKKAIRNFNILKIGINLPREELYQRINLRVDSMLAIGLQTEIETLKEYKNLQALNTVGYKEWWPYFDEFEKLENVITKIKQHTRNFAKRQLTWFRKDSTIIWWDKEQVVDAQNSLAKVGINL